MNGRRVNKLNLRSINESVGVVAFFVFLVILGHAYAQRPTWSTSSVRGMPESQPEYLTEMVLSHSTFDEPVDVVPLPGHSDWFAPEHYAGVSLANLGLTGEPDGNQIHCYEMHRGGSDDETRRELISKKTIRRIRQTSSFTTTENYR